MKRNRRNDTIFQQMQQGNRKAARKRKVIDASTKFALAVFVVMIVLVSASLVDQLMALY